MNIRKLLRGLVSGIYREPVLEKPKESSKKESLPEKPKESPKEETVFIGANLVKEEDIIEKKEERDMPRDISEGIKLIKKWEGLRLKTYKCSAGVDTIGYGSTGSHVKPGMVITEQEAEDLLIKDLKRFTDALDAMNLSLNNNQYSAVLSFVFNLGIGALNSSTLKKMILQKKYPEASREFGRWNKARVNGQLTILNGLTARRKEEAELFLKI